MVGRTVVGSLKVSDLFNLHALESSPAPSTHTWSKLFDERAPFISSSMCLVRTILRVQIIKVSISMNKYSHFFSRNMHKVMKWYNRNFYHCIIASTIPKFALAPIIGDNSPIIDRPIDENAKNCPIEPAFFYPICELNIFCCNFPIECRCVWVENQYVCRAFST